MVGCLRLFGGGGKGGADGHLAVDLAGVGGDDFAVELLGYGDAEGGFA